MLGNLFKKKKGNKEGEVKKDNLATMPGAPKMEDMNMVQRFAYKRIMAMNPQERQKLMQKMLKPENVQKHKAEILEQFEALRKSGQMSDDQIRLAKARLGLK
jgi:hypothetical protein